MDANADASGTSSTHGDDTSIGKKTAPVSLTVRRTSERTSTRAQSGGAIARTRALDARADLLDDPSWRLATARSYSRHLSTPGDGEDSNGDCERGGPDDVGPGRLSPVCRRDGLGARARAGGRVRHSRG